MSKSDLELNITLRGPLWYNMLYEKVFYLRTGKAPIRVWEEDFKPRRGTEPVQGMYVPRRTRSSYHGWGQVARKEEGGISKESASVPETSKGLGARAPRRKDKDCARVCSPEFRQNSGLAKSKPGKTQGGEATKRGYQKGAKGGEWWGGYAPRVGSSDKRNVWPLHLLWQNGEDCYRSLCSYCAGGAHGIRKSSALLRLVQFEEKQP